MARAGLKKVVKTVKGKKKSVRRTYWVKSESPKKKGLGPGGMYHRIDQYIGRASPAKKGLIAAGTTLGMLTAAAALGYGIHKATSRMPPGRASSTPDAPHTTMGGTAVAAPKHGRSPQAQNKLSPANRQAQQYALGGFAPVRFTGLRVATPADARAARHSPYAHSSKKGRAGDMGWFDNLTHL